MSNRQRRHNSQVTVLAAFLSTMLICMVIFGTCAVVLLDVFVTQPALKKKELAEQDKNKPEDTAQTDYSEFRKTILFIGAEKETINGMALLRILPDESSVRIVPISKYTIASVSSTKGTIQSLFESGGMAYLKAAVENAYGISIDNYIKITDSGWKSLVEYSGGTNSYSFPEELYYKNDETGELTSFSAGAATRTLWGDDIRRIITYPLYTDGERTKLQAVGELCSSIINSAISTRGDEIKSNLTNIFNTVFNNSDTDVTTKSFKAQRPAYEHIIDSSVTPASYRIPKGIWEANGHFTVSEEYNSELKEFFGIE